MREDFNLAGKSQLSNVKRSTLRNPFNWRIHWKRQTTRRVNWSEKCKQTRRCRRTKDDDDRREDKRNTEEECDFSGLCYRVCQSISIIFDCSLDMSAHPISCLARVLSASLQLVIRVLSGLRLPQQTTNDDYAMWRMERRGFQSGRP